jgi:hypothetical protein
MENNNWRIRVYLKIDFHIRNAYLKATSTGGLTAIKQIRMEVCGAETFYATSGTAWNVFEPSSGQT